MGLKKIEDGVYLIRYYDADDRERQLTVRGPREAAKAKWDEIRAKRLEDRAIRRGLIAPRPEAPKAVTPPPTVAALATAWTEAGRPRWKVSTRQQYTQLLDQKILPTFGARPVTEVTTGDLERWVTGLRDAGLSERRTNLALVIVKTLCKRAQAEGWLTRNPAAPVALLKEPRSEVDPLAPEEVAPLLAALSAWWRSYFTVAVYTGARPNELAALKWGDIDWTRGSFRIRAGRRRGVEGPPKTEASIRDIDLLPPVLEALKAQRGQQARQRVLVGEGKAEPGRDYVFTGPEGGLLNVNYLRDHVWYPALKKAGLRRRTMYQCRHTFASNALAAGEAPSWVAAQLGHTTPEMLFQVYARFIPNRTRRDGSALAARLGALSLSVGSKREVSTDRLEEGDARPSRTAPEGYDTGKIRTSGFGAA